MEAVGIVFQLGEGQLQVVMAAVEFLPDLAVGAGAVEQAQGFPLEFR